MSDQSEQERRRYLRYPPEELEIALVQFDDRRVGEELFEPEAAGLVLEESRAGCGLVMLARAIPDGFGDKSHCVVKVANLGVLRAEVRWMDATDDKVVRLGLSYLED